MQSETTTSTRSRYNLKISREFKPYFEQPYDKFVDKLLRHVGEFNDDIIHEAVDSAPKGSEWTIWLTDESRHHFLSCKNALMPNSTHSQFMNALLRLHLVIPLRLTPPGTPLIPRRISPVEHIIPRRISPVEHILIDKYRLAPLKIKKPSVMDISNLIE